MEFVLYLEDLESAQTEKRVQEVSLDLINEEKFMQALRRIELKMNKEQQSSANVHSALARMASWDVKRLHQPNLKIV